MPHRQAVDNLAWKLSSVVSGASTPRLLDSYDAERRPIAWLRHQQIFARSDYQALANGTARDTPIIDDEAMELGQLYRSTAVLGAGSDLLPARRPAEWAGQPGTRAPHAWVTVAGERRSTLDLWQRSWVLVAADARWGAAAARAGEQLGLDVKCLRIGAELQSSDEAALRAAFGLGDEGASLLRPDGYIAWRAGDLSADPLHLLTEALASVAASSQAPQSE